MTHSQINKSPEVSPFLVLADTRSRFGDFAPYVPSINDHGVVTWQALLKDGTMGIFACQAQEISTIVESSMPPGRAFISHPDINHAGDVSFYATSHTGEEGVYLFRDGHSEAIADTTGILSQIGPLGPTMSDAGVVAFRGTLRSGAAAILAGTPDRCITIAETSVTSADTSEAFSAFHGLPVINNDGVVVFRADRHDGTQGIYRYQPGSAAVTALVTSGERFRGLSYFPMVNNAGVVVFVATLAAQQSGVFQMDLKSGETQELIHSGDRFESIRGALLDDTGGLVYFATPPKGSLGIYRGSSTTPVLCIGQSLLDSTVTEFALNPVSINRAGQLAIRVRLANERQLIVQQNPA